MTHELIIGDKLSDLMSVPLGDNRTLAVSIWAGLVGLLRPGLDVELNISDGRLVYRWTAGEEIPADVYHAAFTADPTCDLCGIKLAGGNVSPFYCPTCDITF